MEGNKGFEHCSTVDLVYGYDQPPRNDFARIKNRQYFWKALGEKMVPLPKFNSSSPKNGWLEYKPFLLGVPAYFHGLLLLNFGGGKL